MDNTIYSIPQLKPAARTIAHLARIAELSGTGKGDRGCCWKGDLLDILRKLFFEISNHRKFQEGASLCWD